MKLVILESPYAGEVERNILYARRAVRHSLTLGEAPIASHLLYTQPGILDDLIPEEREWGINAGLAWGRLAEASIFYIDYGWSRGMLFGKASAAQVGRQIIERFIGINFSEH
jgi:hypothetical protein